MDYFHNSTIGKVGVASALQHAGTPGLEAERKDIEAHVGACLINHPYHAERHTHPFQVQSVGQYGMFQHPSQRRRQIRHMTHVCGNTYQTRRCKFQAVVHRVIGRHTLQIARIFRQDVFRLCQSFIRYRTQYLIHTFYRQLQQLAAGCSCPFKQRSQIHSFPFIIVFIDFSPTRFHVRHRTRAPHTGKHGFTPNTNNHNAPKACSRAAR